MDTRRLTNDTALAKGRLLWSEVQAELGEFDEVMQNVESLRAAAATAMKECFCRVCIHVDEEGRVTSHVPPLEAWPVDITDPELKDKFEQLHAKLGPMPAGTPPSHDKVDAAAISQDCFDVVKSNHPSAK